MPWNLALDAAYIGKKGSHLYFANAGSLNHQGPEIEHFTPAQLNDLVLFVPNPFADSTQSNASQLITDPNNPIFNPTIQKFQLQVPFPQFFGGFVGDEPPVVNSIYHALQVRAEKNFSTGLQFLVTHTFSKSIDTASLTSTNSIFLGSFASLQDPNNLSLERSLSSFDIPHILQFSYMYELSVGRGKAMGSHLHPVLNAIVGGWWTNGILRFNSGRPIVPQLSSALSRSPPTYGPQRPDLIGAPVRNQGPESSWLNQYFSNPNDIFAQPSQYAIGNAPRTLGSDRQPGAANADLSLFKEIPMSSVREGMRLEYRFEIVNSFNHPQFCGPNTTFGHHQLHRKRTTRNPDGPEALLLIHDAAARGTPYASPGRTGFSYSVLATLGCCSETRRKKRLRLSHGRCGALRAGRDRSGIAVSSNRFQRLAHSMKRGQCKLDSLHWQTAFRAVGPDSALSGQNWLDCRDDPQPTFKC